jgi:hypothetical protein
MPIAGVESAGPRASPIRATASAIPAPDATASSTPSRCPSGISTSVGNSPAWWQVATNCVVQGTVGVPRQHHSGRRHLLEADLGARRLTVTGRQRGHRSGRRGPSSGGALSGPVGKRSRHRAAGRAPLRVAAARTPVQGCSPAGVWSRKGAAAHAECWPAAMSARIRSANGCQRGRAHCVRQDAPPLPGATRGGPHQEDGSGVGQRNAPLGAVQHPNAQLVLELADLLADRRLRHVQSLGGPAEMQLLRDRHEISEMPKVHVLPSLSVDGASMRPIHPDRI